MPKRYFSEVDEDAFFEEHSMDHNHFRRRKIEEDTEADVSRSLSSASLAFACHSCGRGYENATLDGISTPTFGEPVLHNCRVREAVEQALTKVSQSNIALNPLEISVPDLSKIVADALLQHIQQQSLAAHAHAISRTLSEPSAMCFRPRHSIPDKPPIPEGAKLLVIATQARNHELAGFYSILQTQHNLSIATADTEEALLLAFQKLRKSLSSVLIDGESINSILGSGTPKDWSTPACKELLKFTRRGGACAFGSPLATSGPTSYANFDSFMSKLWQVPWYQTVSNQDNVLLRNNPNYKGDARGAYVWIPHGKLPEAYNPAGAITIGGVPKHDALYVDRRQRDDAGSIAVDTSVALAKHGKGQLGFFGGRLDDEETLRILAFMLGLV